MEQGLTLAQYTSEYAGTDPQRQAVAAAIDAIAEASVELSDLIGHGALAGITGQAQGSNNADGDVQKDLDVRCDEIVTAALQKLPFAALASEESETLVLGDPNAPISVAFDPLDGSSNIDTNMTVGTIFSIIPNQPGVAPFTAPGTVQLAAGFVVYGPQTSLVVTVGDGVDIFTLDREARVYRCIRHKVQIPKDTPEFAINASNHRHWEQPVRDFVEECIAGADGPRSKDFNMRWIGSLVAEAYRILTRGGVFLYPGDSRPGYADGRLRLLYEVHPMAFIIEQAGGGASTGRERVLELSAKNIHQRAPLIMGSTDKVDRIELLHNDPDAASRTAPLFARRGLFRV
ncbi:D-fructose 1,6-bisphosphatase [Rhodopseudomonas faecalis]|uniref:Fructose-1,6-bisphosphatase class 1 n=1 Tax=Rhodopseudomonas faecalis TaxID=99655 RepID=A0A318TGI6_9BRAD|nr:class 1 fructose-bisphosphatase [Rhodopseudomonas faecalis]PYF03643.1 D-fructose 1,6-bisphosphatase [Rhodopseudomonas faecalis]TAH67216.1 MAG: class 1 fructose-bisphosphatase [Rhodopseudomonas palustris]